MSTVAAKPTTGSFQNQTSTEATEQTTSSSQNYVSTTPQSKASRKRGIAALLADVTNQTVPAKRACVTQTREKISQQIPQAKAPRGLSSVALHANKSGEPENEPVIRKSPRQQLNEPEIEAVTLGRLVKHEHTAVEMASLCIEGYIERNTENAIQRAIGIQVFIKAATTWGYGILQALQMAADVTGASTRSVRRWANAFIESMVGISPDAVTDEAITDLLSFESGRTKASWQRSLINDEEFRLKAREYVRSRAHRRGEPNLTANMFLGWIQETYHVDVCAETARLWLHNLGFSQTHHHKGMYFDGHERDDVVQYRHKFVQKLDDLDRRCEYGNHPPQLLENEKPIVIVHHDKSTFYANADQSSYWGDDTIQALKQNRPGYFLRHRVMDTSTMTNSWSKSVDGAIIIFEKKFPDSQALFLFDNAPSHCKVSDDALNDGIGRWSCKRDENRPAGERDKYRWDGCAQDERNPEPVRRLL